MKNRKSSSKIFITAVSSILSLLLIFSCQPSPFQMENWFKDQSRISNKIDQENKIKLKTEENSTTVIKNNKSNFSEKIEVVKEKSKIKNKNIKTAKLNSHQKKLKKIDTFQILNHIGKTEKEFEKILGKSNFVVKDGVIKNLQFHFEFCYVDFYFKKSNIFYKLVDFKMRSVKISEIFNKDKCLAEIKSNLNN